MPTPKKIDAVTKLKELIEQHPLIIVADHRGLSMAELEQLRRRLRAQGARFQVVKNTLARRAAQEAGKPELAPALTGPTAFAFSKRDGPELAQGLQEHIRVARSAMIIRGGLLGHRLLDAALVAELASLPPREVIVARLLGQMQGPIASLLIVLNGNLRGLMTVLQGRVKQLEGGEHGRAGETSPQPASSG